MNKIIDPVIVITIIIALFLGFLFDVTHPVIRNLIDDVANETATSINSAAYSSPNRDYYAKALSADRAVIPGLPSAEVVAAAEDNPEKLLSVFYQAKEAYVDFYGGQRRIHNNTGADKTEKKIAYYHYRRGEIFQQLGDKERACFSYQLADDRMNSSFYKQKATEVCPNYSYDK